MVPVAVAVCADKWLVQNGIGRRPLFKVSKVIHDFRAVFFYAELDFSREHTFPSVVVCTTDKSPQKNSNLIFDRRYGQNKQEPGEDGVQEPHDGDQAVQ